MGGVGSGRRSSFPTTLDDLHAVDLRYLRRQKRLSPGHHGSLRWSRCGRETGSIGFSVGFDNITLSYRTRALADPGWEDIREVVPLLRTTQPLGGERLWFGCPYCRRRCAILYGGRRFRCHRCVRAPYGSQNEGTHDRLLRRAKTIRKRLGGSGATIEPFPPKPKGMHWTTYARMAQRCQGIEATIWQAEAQRLGLNDGDEW